MTTVSYYRRKERACPSLSAASSKCPGHVIGCEGWGVEGLMGGKYGVPSDN